MVKANFLRALSFQRPGFFLTKASSGFKLPPGFVKCFDRQKQERIALVPALAGELDHSVVSIQTYGTLLCDP
jgi:hypothetical protein